jgi:hypothetical protein
MNHPKINYIILLLTCIITAAVAVTLISPPEVAPVCSGDELELACTAPGRALEWNITLMPPSEDMTYEYRYPLNSVEQSFPVHTITVNNVSFIFSRISPSNSRPLISRLLISPATNVVDGILVVCADRETRTNSSTSVNVVHNNGTLIENAIQGRSLLYQISVLIILLNWYKVNLELSTGYGIEYLAWYNKSTVI